MPKTEWEKAKRLLRKYKCQNCTELLSDKIAELNWVMAFACLSLAANRVDHGVYVDMDYPDIVRYKKFYSTQLFLTDFYPELDREFFLYVGKHEWKHDDAVGKAYKVLSDKVANGDVRVIVLDRDNLHIMSVPRLLTDLRYRLKNLPGDLTYKYECAVCLEKVKYLNND